jgi:hypothetical protein
MTLTIEPPPEMAQQLQEAAARAGRHPAELAKAAVEEKLAALQAHDDARRQPQLAMLKRWNAEDAARSDDLAAPTIPRLSLPALGVRAGLADAFAAKLSEASSKQFGAPIRSSRAGLLDVGRRRQLQSPGCSAGHG